jgi:EAL domain-containing protein (putative c-di-GMP-specific phosphodiesterase class I)
VNLSARQFNNELPNVVANVINQTHLPPALLELELTESLLMDKKDLAIMVLEKLQLQGVQLSIDDFGTGYSSLNYLKCFPLNRLKIDRSFIKDLTSSPDDEIIIEAIIALAHGLRLKVVAEGVETDEQLAFIRDKQCDEVQGFLFAEPMPAAALSEFLHNHQSR